MKYLVTGFLIIVGISTRTSTNESIINHTSAEPQEQQICLYQDPTNPTTEISQLFLEITPPRAEKIAQISQNCKRRKSLFTFIRSGALIGTIGFIGWKLLRKKQAKNNQNLEEDVVSLTQRIKQLEEKLSLTAPAQPSTRHWLLQEAQQLGSHAGNLIVDGLISALVVDAITGSITNAVSRQVPLNELLSTRPSFDWLLQNHTSVGSHINGCLHLLDQRSRKTAYELDSSDNNLPLYYLGYHTQELMHDVEKVLGFLDFEISQTTSHKQKEKLRTLAQILTTSSYLLCKKTNELLRNNQDITPREIMLEIKSLQETLEEIHIKTKKANALLPQLF